MLLVLWRGHVSKWYEVREAKKSLLFQAANGDLPAPQLPRLCPSLSMWWCSGTRDGGDIQPQEKPVSPKQGGNKGRMGLPSLASPPTTTLWSWWLHPMLGVRWGGCLCSPTCYQLTPPVWYLRVAAFGTTNFATGLLQISTDFFSFCKPLCFQVSWGSWGEPSPWSPHCSCWAWWPLLVSQGLGLVCCRKHLRTSLQRDWGD